MTSFPRENLEVIVVKIAQAYLSWNVADFQVLLQPDCWWNKNIMCTFIDAIKEAFNNS